MEKLTGTDIGSGFYYSSRTRHLNINKILREHYQNCKEKNNFCSKLLLKIKKAVNGNHRNK
ncbi:MAG: hypothetical protein HY841_08860 [Bacteroidetes bacterium]|nr:hypothetical protein [Bacteroidota bacterium]